MDLNQHVYGRHLVMKSTFFDDIGNVSQSIRVNIISHSEFIFVAGSSHYYRTLILHLTGTDWGVGVWGEP